MTMWEWGAMVVVERKGVWRGQRGMVVNAHIPQHEGRGMTQPGGWVTVMVEVEDGGGNAKRKIVTQVIGVMICHTSLN